MLLQNWLAVDDVVVEVVVVDVVLAVVVINVAPGK